MNFKYIKNFILFLILVFVLSGCAAVNKNKSFKHDTPLIKEDIKKIVREEVQKTVEMGPQPSLGEAQKLTKRKKISSQKVRNYLLIPDEYETLKQLITFKFQNLDYKEAMLLMGKIGEINV